MTNYPEWFKTKKYIHFSSKIGKNDFYKVNGYVRNKAKIEKHAFYPLIHYEISMRKYKKILDENGNSTRDSDGRVLRENNNNTQKIRKIDFANHLDSQIYSFYAQELIGKKYEQKLVDAGISENITGYRRIPSERLNEKTKKPINKCNIDFAYDAFQEIKNRNTCIAITFDIKDFFPSLNHNILKEKWCEIIDEKRLPKDEYTIYKSLTKFAYVYENDIQQVLNIPHKKEIKRKKYSSYFSSPKQFRELVRKSGLIKINKKNKGIPQGTPLSALMSNIYLFGFDKSVVQKVEVEYGGVYLRYSDDIVVICNKDNYKEIENFIIESIKNYNLEIHKTKTKTHIFETNEVGKIEVSEIGDNNIKIPQIPLQYLGFEFNGSKIYLKSASLAKYYRNMKSMVNLKARRAGMKKIDKKSKLNKKTTNTEKVKTMVASKPKYKGKGIFKEQLFLKYSHLGKSNYISYAKRASEIMNEPAIDTQISRHWIKLNLEIKKYQYPTKYVKNKTKIDFDIF